MIPVAASLVAACGGDSYYDDPSCNPALYPAVEVRLIDAASGQPIRVAVRGTVHVYRSGVTELLSSPDPGYEVDARTSLLQGGFGEVGYFDVSVTTDVGERYDWSRLEVTGDYCRVFTTYLDAVIHYPDR